MTKLKDWERRLWRLSSEMQIVVGGRSTKMETLTLYAWEAVRDEIKDLEDREAHPVA